jgi:hypothetical protein
MSSIVFQSSYDYYTDYGKIAYVDDIYTAAYSLSGSVVGYTTSGFPNYFGCTSAGETSALILMAQNDSGSYGDSIILMAAGNIVLDPGNGYPDPNTNYPVDLSINSDPIGRTGKSIYGNVYIPNSALIVGGVTRDQSKYDSNTDYYKFSVNGNSRFYGAIWSYYNAGLANTPASGYYRLPTNLGGLFIVNNIGNGYFETSFISQGVSPTTNLPNPNVGFAFWSATGDTSIVGFDASGTNGKSTPLLYLVDGGSFFSNGVTIGRPFGRDTIQDPLYALDISGKLNISVAGTNTTQLTLKNTQTTTYTYFISNTGLGDHNTITRPGDFAMVIESGVLPVSTDTSMGIVIAVKSQNGGTNINNSAGFRIDSFGARIMTYDAAFPPRSYRWNNNRFDPVTYDSMSRYLMSTTDGTLVFEHPYANIGTYSMSSILFQCSYNYTSDFGKIAYVDDIYHAA